MRYFLVFFQNVFVFILAAIQIGHPPWRWHIGWKACQEAHLQDVRKAVWELKCQGAVREDKSGRLFSVGGDE